MTDAKTEPIVYRRSPELDVADVQDAMNLLIPFTDESADEAAPVGVDRSATPAPRILARI